MKKIMIKSNKSPNQLIWILCLTLLPLLGACRKEGLNEDDSLRCPVTSKEGPEDSVIGKWKLVKVLSFDGKFQDYSCDNVFYYFKEEGILTISGVKEGMISRGNGEYAFEVTVVASALQIVNSNYYCRIQKNEIGRA